MRVSRGARAAVEVEGDANVAADGFQPLENGFGALGAELCHIEGAFRDAGDGRVRVKVIGVPGRGEGVGWMAGLVEGDGAVEIFFTNVALLVLQKLSVVFEREKREGGGPTTHPWADSVRDDRDSIISHSEKLLMESQIRSQDV